MYLKHEDVLDLVDQFKSILIQENVYTELREGFTTEATRLFVGLPSIHQGIIILPSELCKHP